MIKINHITPPTFNVFEPSGKLLGNVNEYELLNLCLQIKKDSATGYYLFYNNYKIQIDKNGVIEYYPTGLLDTMALFNLELLK